MLGEILDTLWAMTRHHLMRPLWGGVLAFALLFALALAIMPMAEPMPVQAQNTACFRAQGGDLWACASGGEMEFRSGATLDVQNGATLSIDDFLTVVPQSSATITNGGSLTPTGTFQLLTSIAGVGMSGAEIADGDEGDLLILLNIGANTITFTETTGLISAGNIALGTLDSATLIYRGTSWYQIAASNN